MRDCTRTGMDRKTSAVPKGREPRVRAGRDRTRPACWTYPWVTVILRLWHKRILRIAVVCLALAFLPGIPPVARTLDNLWLRASERCYALPEGARLWEFRAVDRADRSPGWTCGEDDLRFFVRVDTGILRLWKKDISPLADPCTPPEDPDTLIPEEAMLPLKVDSNQNSVDSGDDSLRP